MAARKPWYESLFKRDYYDYFYAGGPRGLLMETHSDAQVEFLVDALQPPAGGRVLDLCCGHGRHAVRFAERGYRVTGLDLSAYHLRLGAKAARERGVEVEWVRADMREVPGRNRFDAIVNLFTAFGYFDDEREDLRVLEGVARALKPGGRFLVDLMNRDGLMGRFRESGCSPGPEGGYVAEMREFDVRSGRINVDMLYFPKDGRVKKRWHSIRLYTYAELEALMSKAGLTISRAWGNYDGSDFRLRSPRMMVMAERAR